MPRTSGTSQGDGIQAVLLALGILEHMAQHGGAVGVTELSQAFATTKSRIHRHLQTLVNGGYVIQDLDSDRYRISARLMAMGDAVSHNFDLTTVARPVMDDLRANLGHSVAVSVPEEDGVRIVSVVRGGSNAEIGVRPGSLLSFHGSSQGKLTLAFGERDLADRVLGGPLSRETPHTIDTPAKLKAEIAEVKRRGWATSGSQSVVGLNALAAPIFGAMGEYVGAVAIVDSVQYIADDPKPVQVSAVMAAAARISGALGYRVAS